jgi:SPRY domain
MAKVFGPLLSQHASGSVGDLLTYLDTPNGPRVIRKPRTSDNTPAETRARYADACAEWQTFDAGDKAPWNTLGAARGVTGFNAFISDRMSTSTPAPTYATFDADHAGPAVTITGGGLSLSVTEGAYEAAIAPQAKTTGKWYFEASIVDMLYWVIVGVANLDVTLLAYLSSDGNGMGYAEDGGTYGYGASGGHPAFGNGDIVGFAVNLDDKEITFTKNDAEPFTIALDNWSEYVPALSMGAANNITYNFGASAFAGTVPVGYNAGWYE